MQTAEYQNRIPLDLFVPRCFSRREIDDAFAFVSLEITTVHLAKEAPDEGLEALDSIIQAIYLQYHQWDGARNMLPEDEFPQTPLHFFVPADFSSEQIGKAYNKLMHFAQKASQATEDAYPGELIGLMGALRLLYRIKSAYHWEINGERITLSLFDEEPEWEDFSQQVPQERAETYMWYYLTGPRGRANQPMEVLPLAQAAAEHFFLKSDPPPERFIAQAQHVLARYQETQKRREKKPHQKFTDPGSDND